MHPMSDARAHYARLLAEVYEWSVSCRGSPFERARAWLEGEGLLDATRYLDLGAGFGAHARPLIEAGKTVTAVDFDAHLLDRLRANVPPSARLAVWDGDLVERVRAARERWDVILCAGDTLTHLPSEDAVRELLRECAAHLDAGGRLALAYRDSTRLAATGVDRFVEVARDATRAMHCLLEPIDAGRLRVTDIVTDVHPDGPRVRISEYVKLRLAPDAVAAWANDAGLTLEPRPGAGPLVTQVFGRTTHSR